MMPRGWHLCLSLHFVAFVWLFDTVAHACGYVNSAQEHAMRIAHAIGMLVAFAFTVKLCCSDGPAPIATAYIALPPSHKAALILASPIPHAVLAATLGRATTTVICWWTSSLAHRLHNVPMRLDIQLTQALAAAVLATLVTAAVSKSNDVSAMAHHTHSSSRRLCSAESLHWRAACAVLWPRETVDVLSSWLWSWVPAHSTRYAPSTLADAPQGIRMLAAMQHSTDASAAAIADLVNQLQQSPMCGRALLLSDGGVALRAAMCSRDEALALAALRLLLLGVQGDPSMLEAMARRGVLRTLAAVPLAALSPCGVRLAALATAATLADTYGAHATLVKAGAMRCVKRLGSATDVEDVHQVALQVAGMHAAMVLLAANDDCVVHWAWRYRVVPDWVAAATLHTNPAVTDAACSAMAAVAVGNQQRLVEQLVSAGGVEALVLRIQSPRDGMAATAAAALACLASDEAIRQGLVARGVVPLLVRVMTMGNEEARAVAMYALEAVVQPGDVRAGAEFVEAQGVPCLVGMLRRLPTRPAAAAVSSTSGAALLGSLYQTTPGIRAQVLAAGSLERPALELLLRSPSAQCTRALMAQIYRDAGGGVLPPLLCRQDDGKGLASAA